MCALLRVRGNERAHIFDRPAQLSVCELSIRGVLRVVYLVANVFGQNDLLQGCRPVSIH
jgi:hypothetical protein